VLKADDWASEPVDVALCYLRLQLRQVLRGLLEAAKQLGGVAAVIEQDPLELLVPQLSDRLQVPNELRAIIGHNKQGKVGMQAICQELEALCLAALHLQDVTEEQI